MTLVPAQNVTSATSRRDIPAQQGSNELDDRIGVWINDETIFVISAPKA
ncbi:MAG: hypothetical protein ACP5P1_07625 [Acidimicrobiales bacterium]